MNPDITRLNPYPFAKLRTLFEGIEPIVSLGTSL